MLNPVASAAEGYSCGSINGYHYAGQLTALDNTFTQCGTTREYQGWNGVDGQLQTPATLASLGNYQTDHSIGLLSAQLANDKYWLQLGWYTGIIGGPPPPNCVYPSCTWRGVTYGYYVENMSPAGYTVEDFGQAPLNSGRTSDLIYNASSGCWEAYLTYGGNMSMQDCYESVDSGAMWVTTEMESSSGVAAGMPLTYFGASNSGTNQALHVHGGAGWVSWNGSLSSYGTEAFDERYTSPKYWISRISNCCWYFESFKQ
jgi:hypothetical protein